MTTKRPKPAWAPIPLSEISIAVGVGLLLVMFLSKGKVGIGVTVAGLLLISFGATEVIWREHRARYRSHAALLAALAVFPFVFVVGTVVGNYKEIFLLFGVLSWFSLWILLKKRY